MKKVHEVLLDINYGPSERASTHLITWCWSHRDHHQVHAEIPHLAGGEQDWAAVDAASPAILGLLRQHAGLTQTDPLYAWSTGCDHILTDSLEPLCGTTIRFSVVSTRRREGQSTDSDHTYRPVCVACATHGLSRPTPEQRKDIEVALVTLRRVPRWRASTQADAAKAMAELCTVLEAVPYTAALLNECGWRWHADANAHDRSRQQGSGNGRLVHDAQSDEFTRCRLTATGGYHWCHPAHTWGRAVELDCQVSDWLGWDRSYFSKGTVPPGVVVRKAA